jgi:ribonuclease HI
VDRDNVLFIDGSSLIYRAIYRATYDGHVVQEDALAAFVRHLTELDETFRPTYVAFALDCPRDQSERRQLFPGYKAQRAERPPEVAKTVRVLSQFAAELGLPCVGLPHQEADDVIASLAAQFSGPAVRVFIVSRDKDFHQLVRKGVCMWDPFAAAKIGPRQVRERWGVKPAQVVEIQCLAGDTVDNIPGAPGIGIKRATELIKAHGTARAVWEKRTTLTPALANALARFDLETSYSLVRLRPDLPLPVKPKAMEWNGLPSKTRQLTRTFLDR